MVDMGMPTLIETNTLEECAALCHELGLQFIELNMNLPQYQIHKIDVPYFKAVAEKYGIYYTIHLDENLNISDFNPYVSEAYFRTVKDTVDVAGLLNVPVLNMHMSPGVHFTLPDKKVFLFDKYRERYLQSIIDFRDKCKMDVSKSNIKICLENSGGYTDFQIAALDLLLQSPIFALTFDIGHNHNIGGADEPIIMKYADRLCHIHIHDALGKKGHLTLGTGELDLQKYFSLAKEYDCRIVLETKTIAALKQSTEWIRYQKLDIQ